MTGAVLSVDWLQHTPAWQCGNENMSGETMCMPLGCKNRPHLFPGQLSYKSTKPHFSFVHFVVYYLLVYWCMSSFVVLGLVASVLTPSHWLWRTSLKWHIQCRVGGKTQSINLQWTFDQVCICICLHWMSAPSNSIHLWHCTICDTKCVICTWFIILSPCFSQISNLSKHQMYYKESTEMV